MPVGMGSGGLAKGTHGAAVQDVYRHELEFRSCGAIRSHAASSAQGDGFNPVSPA